LTAAAKVDVGWAPMIGSPLIRNAGVPVTPMDCPYWKSFWTAASLSAEVMSARKRSTSRSRFFATPVSYAGVSFPLLTGVWLA
jgi:hypothetical protein